jgi:elongation factor Tu
MDRSNSFLMGIEDVFRQNGAEEVCVSGKVVRGALAVGSEVDIIGFGPTIKHALLADIRTPGGFPLYALHGVYEEKIWRGQSLATPGTIKAATTFFADVLFDERYEKLTQTPYMGRYRWQFHIHHGDYFGSLYLPPGKENIKRGDRFTAQISLDSLCALEAGLHFGIGKLLGQGTVLSMIA